MKIPTLVLSPIESRDRQGVVTPAIEGVVDTSYDSWHLWKGLGDPDLLLSPDGSFDRNGSITPDVHSSIGIVDGQYGKAWSISNANTKVAVPFSLSNTYTILYRSRVNDRKASTGYLYSYMVMTSTVSLLGTGRGGSASSHIYWPLGVTVGPALTGTSTWPLQTWMTQGGRYDGEAGSIFVDGENRLTGQRVGSVDLGDSVTLQAHTEAPADIESLVIYQKALSDEEIQRISTMPTRWQWGSEGTLRSALSSAPVSVVVRYTQGTTIVTEQVVLNGGIGSFGNNQIKYDFDNNTLSIKTETDVKLYGIAAYEEELTDQEMEALSNVDEWTWAFLMPRVGGVIRTDHSQVEVPEDHIGALPTMLAPLEGDLEARDRHGVATMTYSGALRWVDGPRTERKKVSPLLVASPDRTEDRQGPLTPFLSSSVTLGEGQYGKTWKLKKANTPTPTILVSPDEIRGREGNLPDAMEETTNLCHNPVAAESTTGWTYVGNVNYERDTTVSHIRDTSVRYEFSGSGSLQGGRVLAYDSFQKGEVITGSVWVKTNKDHYLRMLLRESSDGKLTSNYTWMRANQWTRLAVTHTVQDEGNLSTHIRVDSSTDDNELVMWLTEAQIERGPKATPYVDGDMPEGTWTGTPHNSPSQRARGSGVRGAVRPTEGTRTIVEEGTENLIYNPRYTNTMAHWLVHTSIDQWAIEDGAFKCIKTSTAPSAAFSTLVGQGVTGKGDVFTASVYCRSDEIGATATIRMVEYNAEGSVIGGTSQQSPVHTITSSSEFRLEWTLTVQHEEATYFRVYFDYVGDSWSWWRNPQVEKNTYATSYCDGSMGTYHEWTGTPDASTSTRETIFAYEAPSTQGWFFEEATINYAYDPRATNTLGSGWGKIGTNTRMETSTDTPMEGIKSVRYIASGTVSSYEGALIRSYNANVSQFAEGEVWTCSAYVKGPQGLVMRILVRENASGHYTSTNFTFTGEWQRVSHTHKITATDVSYVGMRIDASTGYTAYSMLVAAPQLEHKEYATTFCHGSMGQGYSWETTEDASASIRQASHIRAVLGKSESARGSVFARVRLGYRVNGNQYPFGMGNYQSGGSGDFIGLSVRFNTYGTLYVQRNASLSQSNVPWPEGTFEEGVWKTIYIEWDGKYTHVYLDGNLVHIADSGDPISHFKDHLLFIGSRNAWEFNGDVSTIAVFDRPLNETERTYIHGKTSWTWDELSEVDGEVVVGQLATTNHVLNPRFESDADGWVPVRVATEQDTSVTKDGVPSVKLTNNTDGSSFGYVYCHPQGFEAGKATTLRVFAKSETPHTRARVLVQNGGTSTDGIYETDTTVSSDRWTELVVYIPEWPASWTTPRLYLETWGNTVGYGESMWFSQPQLEQRPYPTPYVDGSMSDAVWNGDPHNSTSTRIARGDVNYVRNTLIRYVEDGEHKVARLEGRAVQVGTKGRFATYDGSLRLLPNDGSTLEVEDVVLYEHDVEQIEDKVAGIEDTWSVRNTTSVMDVPIKVPFIEEGTTNLITNATFNYGITGWNWYGADAYVQHDPTGGIGGTGAIKVMTPAATPRGVSSSGMPLPVTAGRPVTFSAYLRGTGTVALVIRRADAANQTIAWTNSPAITLTDQWMRYEYTIPSLEANTTQANVYVQTEVATAATFWMDNPQLEQKPYATTFCPQLDEFGNLREGYSWTGTPHSSSSVRSEARAHTYLPSLSTARGSAIVEAVVPAYGASNRYAFALGLIDAIGQDFIGINYGSNPNVVRFITQSNFGPQRATSIYVPPEKRHVGARLRVYVEWDGTHFAASVERQPLETIGRDEPTGQSGNGRIWLGNRGGFPLNDSLGGVVLFDRPLTESERTKLFAMETWEWEKMQPVIGGSLRRKFNDPILVTKTSSV